MRITNTTQLRSGGKEGASEKIAELLRIYEKTGKIGNVFPKNKRHAVRMAIAIANGEG